MLKILALALLLLIGACTDDPAEPTLGLDEYQINGLVLDALTLERAGGEVVVIVTLTNPTASTIAAKLPGSCMLRPRLYAANSGTIAWDGIKAHTQCNDEWLDFVVPPGQTHGTPWQHSFRRAEVDSLRSGLYSMTAALRPSGRFGNVVELQAGSIRL